MRIDAKLIDYINTLVRQTREWPQFHLGASPRAGMALMQGAARWRPFTAATTPCPTTWSRLALPALRHRVMLTAEAEVEGRRVDELLRGTDSLGRGAAALKPRWPFWSSPGRGVLPLAVLAALRRIYPHRPLVCLAVWCRRLLSLGLLVCACAGCAPLLGDRCSLGARVAGAIWSTLAAAATVVRLRAPRPASHRFAAKAPPGDADDR